MHRERDEQELEEERVVRIAHEKVGDKEGEREREEEEWRKR